MDSNLKYNGNVDVLTYQSSDDQSRLNLKIQSFNRHKPSLSVLEILCVLYQVVL